MGRNLRNSQEYEGVMNMGTVNGEKIESIEEPVQDNESDIRVRVATGSLNNSEEMNGLYEAASNIVSIRESRQDCIVRRMYCTVHNQEAKRYTSTKRVWTRNKKIVLYTYRSGKPSVVRCDGHMGTYLATMGRLDGAEEEEGVEKWVYGLHFRFSNI